jgi:hypothetical protein
MRKIVLPLVVAAFGLVGHPSAAQTEPKQPAATRALAGIDREAELEAKIAALEAELARVREQVRQVNDERIKAAESVDILIREGGLERDGIRADQEALATQRLQVTDMQLKILELTNDAGGMATALANSQERIRTLESQIERYQALDAEKASQTKVEGVVENPTRSLVEIAVGSDDGVKRGMLFDVLREGKPVGRIKILYTSPHSSVGTEFAGFNMGDIQKGDRIVSVTQ